MNLNLQKKKNMILYIISKIEAIFTKEITSSYQISEKSTILFKTPFFYLKNLDKKIHKKTTKIFQNSQPFLRLPQKKLKQKKMI